MEKRSTVKTFKLWKLLVTSMPLPNIVSDIEMIFTALRPFFNEYNGKNAWLVPDFWLPNLVFLLQGEDLLIKQKGMLPFNHYG